METFYPRTVRKSLGKLFRRDSLDLSAGTLLSSSMSLFSKMATPFLPSWLRTLIWITTPPEPLGKTEKATGFSTGTEPIAPTFVRSATAATSEFDSICSRNISVKIVLWFMCKSQWPEHQKKPACPGRHQCHHWSSLQWSKQFTTLLPTLSMKILSFRSLCQQNRVDFWYKLLW